MSKKIFSLIKQGKVASYFDFRQNTLLDLSGNGSVATPTSVKYVNGDRGRAIDFGNASSNFSLAHVSAQAITSGVYILFCDPIASQFGNQYLVDKAAGTGTRTLFYSTSGADLSVYDGTANSTITASIIGKRFLAVRFASGQKADFFLDGAYVGTGASANGTITAPTGVLEITKGSKLKVNTFIELNTSTITNQEISQIYDELMSERGALIGGSFKTVESVPPSKKSSCLLDIVFADRNGSGELYDRSPTKTAVTLVTPPMPRANGVLDAHSGVFGTASLTLPAGTTFFNGNYTVEALMKPRDLSALGVLFGGSGTATYIGVNTLGRLQTSYLNSTPSQTQVFSSNDSIMVGKWAHCVWTFSVSGSNVSVMSYVNGELVGSTINATGFTAQGSITPRIGGFAASSFMIPADIEYLRYYNEALGATAIRNLAYQFNKKPATAWNFDTTPPTLANVTAGRIGETEFTRSTSTWKVSEVAVGNRSKKWIENSVAGIAYTKQDKAYGTFVVEFQKPDANATYINFIADRIGGTNVPQGYDLVIGSGEALFLRKTTGGGHTNLFYTANGYFANDTAYKIAISRNTNGVFTGYVKGGAFTKWTLVSLTGGGGDNPTSADNTYTTSKFCCVDSQAGDKFRLLGVHEGQLSISDLENLY